jgi:hypothetical protein
MSRRRWVYTEGGEPLPEPIEVTEDWRNAELRAPVATEAIVHDGVRAPTGEVLDTKKKRREYMRANGLADAQDFAQHWESKAKERAERHSSGRNREAVTRAVVEAFNKLRKP